MRKVLRFFSLSYGPGGDAAWSCLPPERDCLSSRMPGSFPKQFYQSGACSLEAVRIWRGSIVPQETGLLKTWSTSASGYCWMKKALMASLCGALMSFCWMGSWEMAVLLEVSQWACLWRLCSTPAFSTELGGPLCWPAPSQRKEEVGLKRKFSTGCPQDPFLYCPFPHFCSNTGIKKKSAS